MTGGGLLESSKAGTSVLGKAMWMGAIRSQHWLVLVMLVVFPLFPAVKVRADAEGSTLIQPPSACLQVETQPGPQRERRMIYDQFQFVEAMLDPNVGCMLLSKSITLDDESWAPEGPLFKGKGCIRYVWPFCAHQILTHTVVITPAPGKSAAEVEVHMQPSPYLSTFVEFVDTGKLIVAGLRIYGVLDITAFDATMGRAVWEETQDGDISSLQNLDFKFDERAFFGGNILATDTTGFMYCSAQYLMLLTISTVAIDVGNVPVDMLEMFPVQGLVVMHNMLLSDNVWPVPTYVIHPKNRTSSPSMHQYDIEALLVNTTFYCCEALECFSSGCDGKCSKPPRTDQVRDGPVHYDGNEYTLHSSVATAPKAEQSCSSFGAHLASFGTMAEYYMATKALFDTDTGYLLHQLNLPVWLNNSQAPELAWHWDMHPGAPELWNATGSGSGSGKCVAMGIQNQLMSAHHCANRFPYICQRKLDPPPLLLNGPPPPRALGPPELSSGDVSAGLFGTGIDLTVALVVGALLVLSAMCLVAYMDRRLVEWTKRACCARPSRANPRAANALGGGSKSFHQMHSRRGKIFAQLVSEVEVDGEQGTQSVQVQEYHIHVNKLVSESAERPPHSVTSQEAARPGPSHNTSVSMEAGTTPSDPECAFAQASCTSQNDSVGQPESGFPSLEGFEMLRELGMGTFARCYLAKDNSSGELCAVKVPRMESATMKTVHEAYFLQILKHPNVLAHKRTMVRKGTIVLATEYCDLGELHALLTASRRPLSERFVRHALLQCALGLSHMHARHVAHRDIKPENILVASGGYFKLADLGASCMTLDMEHTSFVGTPMFMAPEVLKGTPHDIETDIYSLGCVVYMMCMLRHPYRDNTVQGLHDKIMNSEYKPIPKSLFSQLLVDLASDMMNPDAKKRPTAAQICDVEGWLFQFCEADWEHFEGSEGVFHQELSTRLEHQRSSK